MSDIDEATEVLDDLDARREGVLDEFHLDYHVSLKNYLGFIETEKTPDEDEIAEKMFLGIPETQEI